MSVPTIRPARPDDAPEVRALGRAAWHAAYDGMLGAETVDERVTEWWSLDGLRTSARDDEDVLLVAERPGDPDRYVGCQLPLVGVAHAAPEAEGTWQLGRLYVHPDRWGEGVGTALLERVVPRLPATAERLHLSVLAGNEVGIGFYEVRGFERVGETTHAGDRTIVYEPRLSERWR